MQPSSAASPSELRIRARLVEHDEARISVIPRVRARCAGGCRPTAPPRRRPSSRGLVLVSSAAMLFLIWISRLLENRDKGLSKPAGDLMR